MTSRALAVEKRGRRILAATRTLFVESPYEQITLEAVAARAGVTFQTVLRRFGSKSRLVAAAARDGAAEVEAQRDRAPVGNHAAAVANLFEHYEKWGDLALRLLAQEERFEEIASIAQRGRRLHAAWIERVFQPELARSGRGRAILRAQLITICDVYSWKLLRRDIGLSRSRAEKAVLGLLDAVSSPGGR